MIKDIQGITINGRNFKNDTNLDFWKESRISILFGRNGTGKSNIADAFEILKGNNENDYNKCEFLSNQNAQITEDDKKNIFVFSEDYIDKNIRVNQEGLKSIVILGNKNIDIEKNIEKYNNKFEETNREKNKIDEELSQVFDPNNSNSPDYWKKQIDNIPRNIWATNILSINGGSKRSFVDFNKQKEIIEKNLEGIKEQNEKELEEKVKQNIAKLNNLRTDSEEINDTFKLELYAKLNSDEQTLKNYLAKKIDKPILSEREKQILDVVNKSQKKFDESFNFIDSVLEDTICPTCFQKVSKKYKDELSESIKKIVGKDAYDYQNELNSLKLSVIEIPENVSDKYKNLCKDSYDKFTTILSEVNTEIGKYNEAIDERLKDIYGNYDITQLSLELDKNSKELNKLIADIEEKRVEHNENIKQIESIKTNALKDNDLLFSMKANDYYKKYNKCDAKKNELVKTQEDLSKKIEEIKKNIRDFNSQRENTIIAIDKINKLLSYVFFDNNRLKIVSSNKGIYELKVKGESVRTKDISRGEINVLALCYFFIETLYGKDENKIYNEPMVAVIDDPISSFDSENHIGVMSLLNQQCEQILGCNEDSKILIMTHDKMTFFDLDKMLGSLGANIYNNKNKFKNKSKFFLSFSENKFNEYKSKYENIYKSLVIDVYSYIEYPSDDKSLTIGNEIRRIIEGYFTFNYMIDFNFLPEFIINKIPETNRDYYRSFMYRLFVNQESHMKEKAYVVDFFDNISEEEKMRLAKSTLYLLYCLDKNHIRQIFKDNSDKEQIVKKIESYSAECTV